MSCRMVKDLEVQIVPELENFLLKHKCKLVTVNIKGSRYVVQKSIFVIWIKR